MSEGQQEAYPDGQSLAAQQQPTGSSQQEPAAPGNQSSPKQTHKRKREHTDDKEEGRSGDGSSTSRRTSFKQTSPTMTSFMPINTTTQQQGGAQYGYQLSQQGGQGGVNGSAPQDATSATLAPNPMSGLLPQISQQPSMAYSSGDSQGKAGEMESYQISQPIESPTAATRNTRHNSGQHSQATAQPAPSVQKPQVGTEEWHRVRRDNHKEVERRRRETINEGINELAKIVPGCEKNKGSILQRAVQYIGQLKENEAANIEKWTVEKLLTEQAIQELSQRAEKLQKECERAWREAETWKKSCLQAGVTSESGGQSGSS